MWCGCVGQLLTCAEAGRHPEGPTAAAAVFLKQAPPPRPLLTADADLCLSSEGSNY